MNNTLIFGLLIFAGFVGGELAKRIRLPKVTGYIVAGILINPDFLGIVPKHFTDNVHVLTNVALSFITFSVGGSLYMAKIRKLGRPIIYITVLESELAFLITTIGIWLSLMFLPLGLGAYDGWFLVIALYMGSFASPTDPSATLAVQNEYKAKGPVMSTIMGVAAFDDILGIINFGIASGLGLALAHHQAIEIKTVLEPLLIIGGSVVVGIGYGALINFITRFIKNEEDSVLLVILSGILLLAFGTSQYLNFDSLLSTMTVGVVVVNYNKKRQAIFNVLERYTDEIIFTLFFTISGLLLNFSSLLPSLPVVVLFILFRASGKALGVYAGGHLSNASDKVKHFVTGGLIPQGGIVIGLALVLKQQPAYNVFADFIINIILGATLFHELLGPLIAKMALRKAGEIKA